MTCWVCQILYFFQLIFISYMHMCLFSSLIHVTSDDGRQTLQWHRFSTIRLLVSAIYRNFGRVKYMIHKYYSPIVKPTKISTIVPFNTSNLRTLSSLQSSLCFFSSRSNPLTSRFIRLSLWPFPSQILPSDLSGFIVLPNTTRYFVPYSEHTTLLFEIGTT
jgi:hypothetical protein